MNDESIQDRLSSFARIGRLEQKMAVIEHQVGQMETVPTRVTKLEQQFEHMASQLSKLNEGQQKLTVTVMNLGSKVTKLLTILTLLGALLQIAVPPLSRVWFP